ncbi:hypothetical protein CEE37_11445 [candidate division LCP-89 bacterium B3_LCP]|uniref:Sulfatase-modifying factor enzyme-like domain-containing protein n=1 Tax=candidate division LCP-89 bacterium B3_LCP TaxID=2012998 RepID=A0A532UVV9_UNCL8|nr:MAG: hypothetical protein CEE37_11445 [candidate division LCP-89 bacterium B3_LCP]
MDLTGDMKIHKIEFSQILDSARMTEFWNRAFVSLLFTAVILLVASSCKNEDQFLLPTPDPIIVEDQVLVPAGEVVLGNDPEGWGNYQLAVGLNPVYLDSFYIDRFEVSNQQYADYLTTMWNAGLIYMTGPGDVYQDITNYLLIEITSEDCPIRYNSSVQGFEVEVGSEELPVVMVTWYGASFYAQYYAKRLPTESEWEKAARGVVDVFGTVAGVGVGYPYPWGDAIPTESLANFGDIIGSPVDVDSYTAGMSWFGAFNMAGNVREWTATSIGGAKIHRGGSFLSSADLLKTAMRTFSDPQTTDKTIGFRCVVDM